MSADEGASKDGGPLSESKAWPSKPAQVAITPFAADWRNVAERKVLNDRPDPVVCSSWTRRRTLRRQKRPKEDREAGDIVLMSMRSIEPEGAGRRLAKAREAEWPGAQSW